MRQHKDDPRVAAGERAERQIAFYLHRAFHDDDRIHLIHNLRLEDPDQPEYDGSVGVCQIDHLVVHRWGMFIVESKAVSTRVRVQSDGHGGDEWLRHWNKTWQGMPSPVRQASRQGELLRQLLQTNRAKLLGRMPAGTRTLSKLLRGDDQRGFRYMPIQLIVAISDRGSIDRKWSPPTQPFPTFILKADQVTPKIKQEITQHDSKRWMLDAGETHGIWSMKPEEASLVVDFLRSRNTTSEALIPPGTTTSEPPNPVAPMPPAPRNRRSTARQAVTPPAPTCRRCRSLDITPNRGPYGPYWKCNECDGNTPIHEICSACGAKGYKGNKVRTREDGGSWFRICDECNIRERIWSPPNSR
jgi:hypothetical protein